MRLSLSVTIKDHRSSTKSKAYTADECPSRILLGVAVNHPAQ